MKPQAVVFDVGNVLTHWQPEVHYDRVLGREARERLFGEVDLHAMNDLIDLGAPFRETVDAACRAAGRDPATLARTFGVLASPLGRTTPPRGSARPDAAVSPIVGSPAEMAETLRGFAREGVSEVQVYLNPTSPHGVEAFAPVLGELDRG